AGARALVQRPYGVNRRLLKAWGEPCCAIKICPIRRPHGTAAHKRKWRLGVPFRNPRLPALSSPGAAFRPATEPLASHPDRLPMTTPGKPKPFSMIREFHLADWFTLGNAICGIGALFSTMTYLQLADIRHIHFACGLLLAALVFDVLDGRIARWRQKTS